MFTYSQSTGHFCHDDLLLCEGYSGFGIGKNNPSEQSVKKVGPIPVGSYQISTPFDSVDFGPICFYLAPDKSNVMYDRSGFLIHGDSIKNPGNASHGCIVLQHSTRSVIAAINPRRLLVIP